MAVQQPHSHLLTFSIFPGQPPSSPSLPHSLYDEEETVIPFQTVFMTVKRACEWAIRGSQAIRGTPRRLILAFTHSRSWMEPFRPFSIPCNRIWSPISLSIIHLRTRCLATYCLLSQTQLSWSESFHLFTLWGKATSAQSLHLFSQHDEHCHSYLILFAPIFCKVSSTVKW